MRMCRFLLFFRADHNSARGVGADKKPVLLGIDVLEARGFDVLQGKQVGLITNQTGVDSAGTVPRMCSSGPSGQVDRAFLSRAWYPWHGRTWRRDRRCLDPRTHIPVYSLYGKTQRPTSEVLNAIDVLVFDMQDVGARYYTYLATMGWPWKKRPAAALNSSFWTAQTR